MAGSLMIALAPVFALAFAFPFAFGVGDAELVGLEASLPASGGGVDNKCSLGVVSILPFGG